MMLFPTDAYSCTLASSCATTPVITFLNGGSKEKGEKAFSFVLILERSDESLSFLAPVASLCCSLVVYVNSLKPCMAMLISDVMGADIVHSALCSSVNLLPCVKPPVLLSDLMSVCSLTRSQLRPAQDWSVRRITWKHSWNTGTQLGDCALNKSFPVRRVKPI